MQTGPKVRSDSRLKTLPDSIQDALAKYLRAHTREETKAWLIEKHGIKTNVASLTDFLQWWQGQKRIEEASSLCQQFEKMLAANPDLDLNSDRITSTGQLIFESIAVRNQDAKLWIQANRERNRSARTRIAAESNKLRIDALKLERDKYEFDAAKSAMKEAAFIKSVASDKSLSEDDKVNKIRRKLFGQLPEDTAGEAA